MHTIFIGNPGFPYGYASIEKIKLLARALILAGSEVTSINSKGIHSPVKYPDLKAAGKYEGINYVYITGSPFRESNFLKRNLLKLISPVLLVNQLYRLNKKNKINYAVLTNRNLFVRQLGFRFLSKLFGFKLILNVAEYYSTEDTDRISERMFRRNYLILNDYLYNKFNHLFADGLILISNFLEQKVLNKNTGIKYLKIPVLTDPDRYTQTVKNETEKYFLFCGNVDYLEIINFIIDSYALLGETDYKLYLIISGSSEKMKSVKKRIDEKGLVERVCIYSGVSVEVLNNLYINAAALLIPLRPNRQDAARFPHKIGEYLFTHNPIVVTNYGEIPYYFKDGENAYVADEYSIEKYSEKLKAVTKDRELAAGIGENGYLTALKYFNFKAYSAPMKEFFKSL